MKKKQKQVFEEFLVKMCLKKTIWQFSIVLQGKKGIFYPFWLKFRQWKANSENTVHKVAWSIQSSSSQCAKREHCNILFDFVTMTIVGPLRSLALLCQSYLSRTYLMSHKLGNSTKNTYLVVLIRLGKFYFCIYQEITLQHRKYPMKKVDF